jgi:DNA-binding response OmpR family regulator
MIYTILLVEADASTSVTVAGMLRRAAYHVLTAPDRATGRQSAVSASPDLVIVNLPEGEGSRLRQDLHADARTEHTPVLLMATALHPDPATATTGDQDAYLPSPPPADTLLRYVDALLRARTPSLQRAGAAPASRNGR